MINNSKNIESKSDSRNIRMPRVCELTGASPATIWRWVKCDPTFPRKFHTSPGIALWDESEILAWVEGKKALKGSD